MRRGSRCPRALALPWRPGCSSVPWPGRGRLRSGSLQRGPFDFYDAKGVVQAIMEDLGIDHVEYARMDRLPYHPGRAASVVAGGRAVGVVGQLHPDVAAAYDVPEGTVLFELELEPLMELATFHSAYSPLPRFPGWIAMWLWYCPFTCRREGVKQAIVQAGGDLVESVRLFDVYTGPQVGEGNRSLAVHGDVQVDGTHPHRRRG